MENLLRRLPQVQALLETEHIAGLSNTYSHAEVTDAVRYALQEVRNNIQAGEKHDLPDFSGAEFAGHLAAQIELNRQASLRPVINATGIIINTNLGRACLAPEAIEAMQRVAAHSSNLEIDLVSGKRGSRYSHTEQLICDLTGAEAALVVNNCAAAVLLSLMATAQGKKVIASRGELIEIGGSFRLPDVIEQSGAILKEVGATNKTRASDYEGAIDSETAVLLKSHTSNFKIVGFTSAPRREDIAELARKSGALFMEDLGSGVLIDLSPYGLTDEPVVADILKAGVDLVMFSGDKLLGGPQCGIIAGRRDIIQQLKTHPLCRAVRIDKLSLAALEATLRLYTAPNDPAERIPVLRALSEPIAAVSARANQLADILNPLPRVTATAAPSAALVGGGSLPQQDIESYAVSVTAEPYTAAQSLAAALRAAPTPIIGRIKADRYQMDARTLTDDDLPLIANAFRTALPS